MEALDRAIAVIKQFEGCRLAAYQDQAGVWTIGWGETLGVQEGDRWTQDKADAFLEFRVGQFLLEVLVRCPQLVFEPTERIVACVSFAYNVGVIAFSSSSVCRLTMRKEYNRAADSFLLWNKAGGRVNAGLVYRRKLERFMYLG